MEVETRVSVQAMRGKFEQKPEDSPLTCVPSPTPKPSLSPGRARASSLIIKDKSTSCDNAIKSDRLASQTYTDNAKHPPSSISKTKSVFSDIVSPMLTGSKVVKAFSPKKHSIGNVKLRKISLDTQKHGVVDDSVRATPSRKISENFSTDTKPSVVRRIPVFKSFNGGLTSEDRTVVKNEIKEPSVESPGRRKKIFGHIRSRSHGNFMFKRDPSVERNGSFVNQVESPAKQDNGHIDLHGKDYGQNDSDNICGHGDSKCSSPFEGKQKIVANVVKNMKNKEKPKVLRKFSFSSKTEKEWKNKIEKASPKANEVTGGKPKPAIDPSTAKMEAIAKSTVNNEKRSSVTGSPIVAGTVSVAKAVADIALVKSSSRASEASENASSPCEETIPPPRPPRRRSTATTTGLSSHKKGMAPSPPGPPSTSQYTHKKQAALSPSHGCDRVPAIDITPDQRLTPDTEKNPDYENHYESSDSLISPQSSDISRENSPIMISQNSPLSRRKKSKSSINVPELSRVYSEGYFTSEDDKDGKKISRNENLEVKNGDQPESESLPAGPPPKKPPRTFAYDIYRSGKDSKSEEDISSKANNEDGENSEVPVTSPTPGPIYAVPLKKKKSENRLTPKPPIRSNSDLSKRDLPKPSVAPKPLHILNKVKRSSVVDPLSCAEKGEDAAMTSKFQRQAHIRYSLRRPKKPPPAPPSYSESEGNIVSDSVSNPNVTKSLAKSYPSLNTDNSKNDSESSISPQPLNENKSSRRYSMNDHSHYTSESIYQSVNSDDNEDGNLDAPSIRVTSRSSYNLHGPTSFEDNQPLSLGHSPMDTSLDLPGIYRKRSMSDETLYKGSRYGDEPIYAMPIFANSHKGTRGHNRQRELHYMCSVLFTDEEEADAGRDGSGSGRANTKDGDTTDGKVSNLISAWKKEFRQSCRQVQNKIKKTVNR